MAGQNEAKVEVDDLQRFVDGRERPVTFHQEKHPVTLEETEGVAGWGGDKENDQFYKRPVNDNMHTYGRVLFFFVVVVC